MGDIEQRIADVLAQHDHWDYAGALHCRCDQEFEGGAEQSVKGWAEHLAAVLVKELGLRIERAELHFDPTFPVVRRSPLRHGLEE